ncbi:MAG: hypothetical protein WBW31_00330, partial [Candidatus Sulfotelmatobacter sp.]
MLRFIRRRMVGCILLLPLLFVIASAQDVNQSADQGTGLKGTDLKGKVQLTRNGRRVNDASKVVVWLTPLGTTPAPPLLLQLRSQIPQLVQKDKSFHPSLLVIPAGGQVEFPNQDPFFHNVFSLFDGKRFDLGLYESGTTQFVKFDKPGISF